MRGSRVQFPPSAPAKPDMSSQPSLGRARARRLETLWNRITLLIGCGAIVGIVAAVIVVISQQMVRTPVVDQEALARAVDDLAARRYASQAREPSLMDSTPKARPVDAASVSLAAAMTPASAAAAAVAGIEGIEGKRDAISATLERFFGAATVDARIALVRDPERVRPLMLNYYSREPMPQPKWRGLGKAMRVDEPGYRFGYVQALFEDSTPATLIIEEMPDGRFLVDWECLVRYGEVSWADFLRIKPAEPKLLRVIASRADGTPAAGAGPQWLELRHPGETGTVLGYFDKADPKFVTLVDQLEQGHWKDVPVTLRLCFPTADVQQQSAGVHIAGVEGKGWLILDRP